MAGKLGTADLDNPRGHGDMVWESVVEQRDTPTKQQILELRKDVGSSSCTAARNAVF